MQADIAANSDSTFRYSQGASSPGSHQVGEALDDVGLRRDRVGARSPRAGRAATASATACEPSSCSKHGAASATSPMHVARRRPRAAATLASATSARRTRSRIAARDRVERDQAGERGEAAEQRRVGQRAPECARRARSVAGTVSSRSPPEALGELAEPELVEARAVLLIEDVAVGRQPGEQVHLVQQGRVLDDQRVGLGDRLARPGSAARRCGRRRPPGRRCARSRSSGTPGRGGPRRRPRPRAAPPP